MDLTETVPKDGWIKTHCIGKATHVVEFTGEKIECGSSGVFIWVAVDSLWLRIYCRNINTNTNMMR